MVRIRSLRFRFGWVMVSAILALACGQDPDHPANIAVNCADGGCGGPPPKGGGGTKDGSTTDTGTEGGDADVGVSQGGTIVELTGDDFVTSIPFATAATVRFEGASGLPVEGPYDGSAFAVDGVKYGVSVWATVTPSTAVALPTVQPTDTTGGQGIELAVVPGTTIDLIYSLLSIPQQREAGAAHVVLRFVDATSGAAVAGVSVSHGTNVVAYTAGGTWSDIVQVTDAFGYAVVVNVATGSGPTKQTFQFSSATDSGGLELQVEPNSVTIADVLVSP